MDEIVGLLLLLAFAAAMIGFLLTLLLVREARRPPRYTAGYALARGLPCDPADLGLRFEEWTLHRPGGTQLPVWEIETEDTERSGDPAANEPVELPNAGDSPAGSSRRRRLQANSNSGGLTAIFIHGWGQSRIDMLARLAPWRKLCDRLVLYELRGHGDSTGSLSNLGCGEADDLLALLEALGPGPFILVGYSMGAVIALEAAARTNSITSRIAAIVAHGPYCDFHRSLQGRLQASGYPTRPITDLAMLWFKLIGIRHRPPELAVRNLSCPLLIIHGTDDIVSPLSHGKRLAAAAPDAELIRIPSGGHLDAHLIDEAAHDAAITRFIQRIRQHDPDAVSPESSRGPAESSDS